MEEAGSAEPRVLKAPNAPAALLARFADNGIELELGVWINDPENGQGNLRERDQPGHLDVVSRERHQDRHPRSANFA